MSTPARRRPTPRQEPAAVRPGAPVEVRVIGHDADVRRLVDALLAAAAGAAGPVSYRPARGGSTRAYLAVTIPPEE